MRTRIYVAGPLQKGDLAHNIRQATDAGLALIRAGYAPLVPHLSCFYSNPPHAGACGIPHATWLVVDLPWVAVSHAVLRLPGESRGADEETALAERLGIPVYHDLLTLLAEVPAERAEEVMEECTP